jgi:TatD DNase family protein
VLARAEAVGCEKVVLTTMTLEGARQNLEVCRRYHGRCYMTLGVHPYHASELYSPPGGGQLEDLTALADSLLVANQPSCLVSLGEIGLDYFYLNRASKEIQQKAFLDQLELATKLDLPLFLHVRDSYDDFATLIKPFIPKLPKMGVVHSFAGTEEEMLGILGMGFDVSVSGVSFATEQQLQMVRSIPLDRLHLETDAPWCELPKTVDGYLKDAPPLPLNRKPKDYDPDHMVKGRNESCTIERVARVVAGVKGISVAELADAAWRNSIRLFGLLEDDVGVDANAAK